MTRLRSCLECGGDHAGNGEFCADSCRVVFNNRRKARGVELYDLFMVLRFERALAKKLRVFQAMCRMASNWRAEDRERRGGRRSWRNPAAVLAERVYLRAIVRRDFTGRKAA